jgi:hypothetical protein
VCGRVACADASSTLDDARVRTADCLPIQSRVVVVADARARAAHLDVERARAARRGSARSSPPRAIAGANARIGTTRARNPSTTSTTSTRRSPEANASNDATRARDTVRLERREGALEDAGVVGDDREARARTREDGRRRGIDRDAARR